MQGQFEAVFDAELVVDFAQVVLNDLFGGSNAISLLRLPCVMQVMTAFSLGERRSCLRGLRSSQVEDFTLSVNP